MFCCLWVRFRQKNGFCVLVYVHEMAKIQKVVCKQHVSTDKIFKSPNILWLFRVLQWLLSLSLLELCPFAIAQSRYLPSIKGYSQHYKIYALIKMEPGREIKLSSWNEYQCFETDNRRKWSSGFHFHLAFLVVEILHQRQLIKYA